jgi:hypothetical protein
VPGMWRIRAVQPEVLIEANKTGKPRRRTSHMHRPRRLPAAAVVAAIAIAVALSLERQRKLATPGAADRAAALDAWGHRSAAQYDAVDSWAREIPDVRQPL